MSEMQPGQDLNFKPDVLIINAFSENLRVIEKFLDDNAVEFRVADSMNGALTAIARDKPDLILLDIPTSGRDVHTTGGDGFEICEKLRSGSETGQIPVISLVEETGREVIRKGFESGCTDFISKPFKPDELAARLGTHLDLCRSRQALIEQNRIISEMNNKLDAALESRDKFVSIIAHDLKDPVASLVGFSEILLQGRAGYEKQELQEIYTHINKTAIHGLNLLNNLLEWTRSQTGRIKYEPALFSFAQLLEEIGELYGNMAERKNIVLITNLCPAFEIYADRRLLHTVLRNLVSNALKFTERGGEIRIGCRDLGNEYEISVSDTGVGIPAEHLDRLFSISEIQSTRGTDDERGTGLGLILCKEFIEKNRGRISVKSQPGQGSVFSFTIPKKS